MQFDLSKLKAKILKPDMSCDISRMMKILESLNNIISLTGLTQFVTTLLIIVLMRLHCHLHDIGYFFTWTTEFSRIAINAEVSNEFMNQYESFIL